MVKPYKTEHRSRITISIDKDTLESLKEMQAYLIKKTQQPWSRSAVLSGLILTDGKPESMIKWRERYRGFKSMR